MRTKFLSRLSRVLLGLMILLAAFGSAPVSAQTTPPPPQPPQDAPPVPGAYYDARAGGWAVRTGSQPERQVQGQLLSTGGPDQFGYTWDDSAAMNWVDAVSGGTLTNLTGSNDMTGAIALPFNFPYYEKSYSKVYISSYGYLTFEPPTANPHQASLLRIAAPNAVIAPFWTGLNLNNTGTTGRVFYKSFGSYFAVVWNAVNYDYEFTITFEVLLYSNGDILFQYKTMPTSSGGYLCWTDGIEDSRGIDGLVYDGFCQWDDLNNKAVKITRPGATARELVYPLKQGTFVSRNKPAVFTVQVVNTGAQGVDTYDLQASHYWPLELLDANDTPLTDTNGNGKVDTGPVNPGATVIVKVAVQTPDLLKVNDGGTGALFVSSALNPLVDRKVDLSAAVPAPFTQVFVDDLDSRLSMRINQPEDQVTLKNDSATGAPGYNLSVTETPEKNLVSAWVEGRCPANNCAKYVTEVYYLIRSHSGALVKGPTRLMDLSAYTRAYSYDPVVTAAPDGTLAITWQQNLLNSSYQYNSNIWLARLSATGTVLGKTNLTNNKLYGDYYQAGIPFYAAPAVAAAGNTFILSWERELYASSGSYNDIFAAGVTSAGSQVMAARKITTDTVDYYDWYSTPVMVSGNAGQAVLVYQHYAYTGSSGYETILRVFNSSGGNVTGPTVLPFNNYNYVADVARFSDGKILVADDNSSGFIFVILDTSYAVEGGLHGFATTDQLISAVSVTNDQGGHAIVTWLNENEMNLNYALVDSNGTALTGPMVMQSSLAGFTEGYSGSNATSWTIEPTAPGGIDLSLTTGSAPSAVPGGVATLDLLVRNLSDLTATGATIEVTFPNSLTPVSGSFSSPCADSDGSVSCTLDLAEDLPFMSSQKISLSFQLPDDPVGTLYPLTLEINADQSDSITDNNGIAPSAFTALQTFVPIIVR